MRYCGRDFTSEEIDIIRGLIEEVPGKCRAELSRLACKALRWYKPDGGLKDMSCRVAMLRMQDDGLLTLPPPRTTNANGKSEPHCSPATDPEFPLELPAGQLSDLALERNISISSGDLCRDFLIVGRAGSPARMTGRLPVLRCETPEVIEHLR